jgi:predicted nucleic acid-binding protein
VELADTSAWAQRRHPFVESWFTVSLLAGQIAICDMVALELLRSEPAATYGPLAGDLENLPWIAMGSEDWSRAREIQARLVVPGRQLHHQVKIADLLIAAAAERAGLTVVHYDRDFDAIANVSGQSARWVVARDTLK